MCDPGKITDSRATVFASLMGELKANYEQTSPIRYDGQRGRILPEHWIEMMLKFAGYAMPTDTKEPR